MPRLVPRLVPRLAARAALLAAAALGAACAHRAPDTAPRPAVPVVPPSPRGAAVALGEPRAARGGAPNAAAAADATAAPRRAPARVFTHAPGVAWDLDVLPFEGHDRVQHYVAAFTGGARDRFGAWLSRGTRYEPMVRARLRAGGLPEDLYYLALVESGYDVHAFSRVGAAGMWQFMPETARELGMRLDWWVDDRRDPVRATDAAVKMLRWLRGQFGSLFVAAAAYNGGPGRVSRGVAIVAASEVATAAGPAADSAAAAVVAALAAGRGGGDHPAAPSDAPPLVVPAVATSAHTAVPTPAVGEARFFALADAGVIAAETRNYVPQLIAAALVGKEAARHGITVRRQEPLAYDEVRVPALTPLAAVAEATGSTRAEILDLNPHLLRGVTPPGGSYVVRVPEGAGDDAAAALAELPAESRRAFRRLVTKKREPFAALAERADVPEGLLRAYNPRLETVSRGKYRGRLVSGQAVRVPTAAALAYARSTPTFGAPGALPGLPAAPPEPKPAKAKAARAKAAERAADAADRPAGDEPRAAERAPAVGRAGEGTEKLRAEPKSTRRAPADDESDGNAPTAAKPARKASAGKEPAASKKAPAATAAEGKPAGKAAAAEAAKSTKKAAAGEAADKAQPAKKSGRRG